MRHVTLSLPGPRTCSAFHSGQKVSTYKNDPSFVVIQTSPYPTEGRLRDAVVLAAVHKQGAECVA
jgi:hypothetical protein